MFNGPVPGIPGLEIHERLEGMDPLEQALRTMEASVHAQGWDQRPGLWAIAQQGGALIARPMVLPDPVANDPGGMLLFYARWLGGQDREGLSPPQWLIEKMVQTAVPRPFRGVVLIHEGWTLPQEQLMDRREEFKDHTVHLAPDRIECRVVTATTVDGRWATVYRERGGFPRYDVMDGMSPSAYAEGRVIDALRLICSTYEKYSKE